VHYIYVEVSIYIYIGRRCEWRLSRGSRRHAVDIPAILLLFLRPGAGPPTSIYCCSLLVSWAWSWACLRGDICYCSLLFLGLELGQYTSILLFSAVSWAWSWACLRGDICYCSLLFLGLELGHLRVYIAVLCLFLGPGAGPAYVEISAIVLCCFSAWSWATYEDILAVLLLLFSGQEALYIVSAGLAVIIIRHPIYL